MGLFIGMTGRPGACRSRARTVLATQLCVPLLRCSPLCKANTSLAIMLHGIALAGAVRVIAAGSGRGVVRRGAAAFAAALASATVFYYAGTRLAPCAYLLSFNQPLGLYSFLLREGLRGPPSRPRSFRRGTPSARDGPLRSRRTAPHGRSCASRRPALYRALLVRDRGAVLADDG